MSWFSFQAGDLQYMQTLVEVHNPMSERTTFFPWEQEGVLHLQQALNSQSSVSLISHQPSVQPTSYADTTLWETSQNPDIEDQQSLDLSTTSNIPSYTSYSPPSSRLTILHPRNVVMSHPLSGQPISLADTVQQDQPTGDSLHTQPSTSLREMEEEKRTRTKSKDGDEDRPCRVCGEKAGKHSYYGGQVCTLQNYLVFSTNKEILFLNSSNSRCVLPVAHFSVVLCSPGTMQHTSV